ncbi:MAG: peptidase M10 [Methylomonas sp.]|nr:peptidase M10 [Methylomonas sp.]
MKKIIASVVVLIGMVFASQANAHIGYRSLDVNNPFTDSVATDFGWYQGTQPTLGNSHDFRWFTFTLAQSSYVDISVAATGAGEFFASSRDVAGANASDTPFTSVGALDVAISLFSGVVPASSVESVTEVNGVLNGFPVPGQGITTIGTNAGPFGAGIITLSNTGGDTSSISYLAHANDFGSGVTEALNNVLLAAGQYTLLVGGASLPLFAEDGITLLNDGTYGVVASLSVQPVPVPGAVWLFGSAMAGLIGFGRRKSLAA